MYYGNDSDGNLAVRLLKDDREAFEIIFRRYYTAMYAYAKQYLGPEESREVVQDIMAWLWEHRRTLNVRTSLHKYLLGAVRHKCLSDIAKKNVRLKAGAIMSIQMPFYDDPDYYIVEELAEKIRTVLAELPESYRQAFEMNRFQNRSYEQIASDLGISVKTVDYRMQKALKILRVKLKDYLSLFLYI